jgi:GNAT superfamily N-acetyltransferase
MKSEVRVRAWRRSDLARLTHLGSRLSPETARARFWGGVGTVPESYLISVAERWPHDWNAVVATRDGQLVGWAEFGRNAVTDGGDDDADLAVCVIDSERGHGTGTALVRALLAQCPGVGLRSIHADIASDNNAALRTWLAATKGLPTTLGYGPDGLRAEVSLAASTLTSRAA